MFPDIALFLLNTQILPPQHHHQKKKNKKTKHWVHLALVHMKNANNNLCESPLTSLVIVTRSTCIDVKKAAGSTKRVRLRSWSRSCQLSNQGESVSQTAAPLFNHEEAHLAWLSGYKSTNKPPENCLPWRAADVSKKNNKKKNQGEKLSNLPKKREADMLSPNGSVLDVHYPCLHKGPAVFCLF